jgi:hypothetical protein
LSNRNILLISPVVKKDARLSPGGGRAVFVQLFAPDKWSSVASGVELLRRKYQRQEVRAFASPR